ncbi:MAG: alpha-ribazole phosphatase [Selenomonadaceae bacterium]|nr:alpha-ribazole phosphatase [Selenomonadaceae bacterium]
MTKLILIRHGETEWNARHMFQGHSDVELAPEGVHQAHLLAAHFPVELINAVYSSDLHRARMTAEIIAEKFNFELRLDQRLREASYGNWEGRSFEELALAHPNEFKTFFLDPDAFTPEGGERFADVQTRAMAALNEIVNAHPHQTAVVVTHGGIIRTLIAAVLGMPLKKMWAIKQFNTAVNILRCDEGNYSVELLNSVEHLHKL